MTHVTSARDTSHNYVICATLDCVYYEVHLTANILYKLPQSQTSINVNQTKLMESTPNFYYQIKTVALIIRTLVIHDCSISLIYTLLIRLYMHTNSSRCTTPEFTCL